MERGNWKIKVKKAVYDNPWISLNHYEVLDPSGEDGIYGVVGFKNEALAIVPIDVELHTYLVGQYRFPVDSYSWEVPEGGGALKKSNKLEALRELKEETGLIASDLYPFLEMQLSNSVTDEISKSFVAFDLETGDPQPDSSEKITLLRVPLSDAFSMVEKNLIKDGLSVASLMRLELILIKNKLTTYSQIKDWFTLHS